MEPPLLLDAYATFVVAIVTLCRCGVVTFWLPFLLQMWMLTMISMVPASISSDADEVLVTQPPML
jgi:hypothetical protein